MRQRRLVLPRMAAAEKRCYITVGQLQAIWFALGEEGYKAAQAFIHDSETREQMLVQWEKAGYKRMCEILGIAGEEEE